MGSNNKKEVTKKSYKLDDHEDTIVTSVPENEQNEVIDDSFTQEETAFNSNNVEPELEDIKKRSNEDIFHKEENLPNKNSVSVEDLETNSVQPNDADSDNEGNEIAPEPEIEFIKNRKKLNNKVVFNIFAIGLLIAIALVLILKVVFSDGGNEALPVPQEEFENGEEISVEKAKEIIEQANKDLGNIQEEQTDTTNEGVLPTLPSEDEEVVDTGTIEYDNSSHGIHFTYPSEWLELFSFTTKEKPENVENIVMVGYPVDSGKIDNMRISIEGTPVSITAKKYFQSTENLMKNVFPKFQLIEEGELTVSGREAPTRTYTWVPEGELERTPYEQEWVYIKQQQIYVAGKDKVYVVTFTSDKEDFDSNFEKYKDIISTLELEN